jgi:hypothetical protein
MGRSVALVASFVLVLGAAGRAVGGEWTPFRSDAGHYAAQFPGTPKLSRFNSGHRYGTLALHTTRSGSYGVIVYDVPENDRKQPAQALDDLRRLLEGAHAAVTPVATNGHDGLELRGEAGGITVLHRLYVANDRLYDVFVNAPARKAAVRDMMKFLDSFSIDP